MGAASMTLWLPPATCPGCDDERTFNGALAVSASAARIRSRYVPFIQWASGGPAFSDQFTASLPPTSARHARRTEQKSAYLGRRFFSNPRLLWLVFAPTSSRSKSQKADTNKRKYTGFGDLDFRGAAQVCSTLIAPRSGVGGSIQTTCS